MRTGRFVLLVTVALIATACSAGQFVPPTTETGISPTTSVHPIPAVVTSTTPSGWVPVAFGNTQVSVPSSFSILHPGWDACGAVSFPGTLELGLPTKTEVGCGAAPPRHPATTVQILYGRSILQFETKPSTVINGLSADPLLDQVTGKALGYYIPALGSAVLGSGPLAGRILRTLSRSPWSVALAPGSAPSVPSGWHIVTFEGLAFAAPASWTVTPTAVAGRDVGVPCVSSGVTLADTQVALSTDRLPFPVERCPYFPRYIQHPINGIEVDGGSLAKFPVALVFSKQCLQIHGLTACPATAPAYSILVLKVTVPGRTTPVLVSIGLAGNGMVARTILNSLRGA